MAEGWYSVGIDAAAGPLSEDDLERVLTVLEGLRDAAGPVVSGGAPTEHLGIQVSLRADEITDALVRGVELFEKAVAEAGLQIREIEHADVMTEAYQDRWLEEEPDGLVGVSELAEMLRVSKQRVGQLRGLPGFPEPVVELAAGPVWRTSTLQRFIREWPRRPGRPRTGSASKSVKPLPNSTTIKRAAATGAFHTKTSSKVKDRRSGASVAKRSGVKRRR